MPTHPTLRAGARCAVISSLTVGVALTAASPALAGPAPVGLGTAAAFGVLAGSGISNTGPTTITGDVGSSPTPSESGFGSVTLHGTDHGGDAVTQQAQVDLTHAFDDAGSRTPATTVATELGGSTLVAGTYVSPTLGLTGTLTLDAQGDPSAVFILRAGSTLTTATGSAVHLIGGAVACHVLWWVGSSATFGGGTAFVGDVLAQSSVTAITGATFDGRLLARDGFVTLDTNTITTATCAAGTPSPSPTSATASPSASPSGVGSAVSATATPTTSATPSRAASSGHSAGASSSATGGQGMSGQGTGSQGAGGSNDGSNGSGSGAGGPASPTSPTLPSTGAPVGRLLVLGVLLLGVGAGAVSLSGVRRRGWSPGS